MDNNTEHRLRSSPPQYKARSPHEFDSSEILAPLAMGDDLCGLSLASMSSPARRPRYRHSGKRVVVVHVTYLKVGEINTLKECFDADVLVRAKWREASLDKDPNKVTGQAESVDPNKLWTPKLFVENAVGEPRVTSSIFVEHLSNGEAYVLERRRIKGSFSETLELWEFPFDVQDLTVNVMSDLSSQEVELIDDPEEIHKIYKQSFIDEQEWYLYKYIESSKCERAKDRADPTDKRSTLSVKCKAARRPAYFIWNIFSVTFLICCLAFVTFAVKPELPQNRLQLSFTLVLTAVAFKFVVNQCLPKISYLTYLDRYILATLIMLTLTCFWHGIQTLIPDADKKDWIAICVLAAGYTIYNIIFIVRIIRIPYKERWNMTKKEAQYVAQVKAQAAEQQPNNAEHHTVITVHVGGQNKTISPML